MFIRFLATVLSTALLSAGASHAATMTFNSFGLSGGGVYTANYVEDGITMSTETGHYDIYGNVVGGTPADNVAAIHYGNGGERVRFTFAAGLFNLNSFDLSGWLVRDTDPVIATVTSSSGATRTLDSSVDATGLVSFIGNAGFQNISWFTIGVPETVSTCVTCSIMGFDNVMMVAPVPLPAAFPLLLAAIGGLSFAARRRKAA